MSSRAAGQAEVVPEEAGTAAEDAALGEIARAAARVGALAEGDCQPLFARALLQLNDARAAVARLAVAREASRVKVARIAEEAVAADREDRRGGLRLV
jgi:hypothetical protein